MTKPWSGFTVVGSGKGYGLWKDEDLLLSILPHVHSVSRIGRGSTSCEGSQQRNSLSLLLFLKFIPLVTQENCGLQSFNQTVG
jgi:hypothetical protein